MPFASSNSSAALSGLWGAHCGPLSHVLGTCSSCTSELQRRGMANASLLPPSDPYDASDILGHRAAAPRGDLPYRRRWGPPRHLLGKRSNSKFCPEDVSWVQSRYQNVLGCVPWVQSPPKKGLSLRERFLTKSAREREKVEDKGHSLAQPRARLKSRLGSVPWGALQCLILSGERDRIHTLVRSWLSADLGQRGDRARLLR